MPPHQPLRLVTPRLVLRELRMEDWPEALLAERDPEVARYQSNEVLDEAGAKAYLEKALRSLEETPRVTFELAITLPSDDRYLGRVGLRIERPEHREAPVWFALRRECWGRGYASEALRGLLDFGFGTLGLHRAWGDCDPRNVRSARVMEKVGMRREGHLRENWWLKGEWCDSHIYGVLEHEWRAIGS